MHWPPPYRLQRVRIDVYKRQVLWYVFMKQSQGGGTGKAMSFGKSRARMVKDDEKKITFADVAGLDEEKEELSEIVDFLKNPAKFVKLGARIPKGVPVSYTHLDVYKRQPYVQRQRCNA